MIFVTSFWGNTENIEAVYTATMVLTRQCRSVFKEKMSIEHAARKGGMKRVGDAAIFSGEEPGYGLQKS